MTNEEYMKRAIEISKDSVNNGNHPFGALLVHNGKIILEAENTVHTSNDETCHAELNLVSQANKLFDKATLNNAVLYTSTEPCAMCTGAIYWSGVATVVYACSVEKLAEVAGKGLAIPSRQIFASGVRKVEVNGPLLEEEAAEVHRGFWA